MKINIYPLLIFIFAGFAASGQTFLYEDFFGATMPPAGWSIETLPGQWSVSQSSSAYGVGTKIPEAKFRKYDTIAGTRLISYVTDLTGQTSVRLRFRYNYQWDADTAPTFSVATRTVGNPWHTVWSVRPRMNDSKNVDLTLTNADVGSDQFQFCFMLEGNLRNINFLFLDDISLINPLPHDGLLRDLTGTPSLIGWPGMVKGKVVNVGSDTIHSAMIVWSLDNGPWHLNPMNSPGTSPLSSFQFYCNEMMDPPPGVHTLRVWIEDINGFPDSDQYRDTLTMTVVKTTNPLARKPFYEIFTSSTCIACPQFDDTFDEWALERGDSITLLKYQMDFPGQGDPYFTEECGIRGAYYAINAIPRLRCSGRHFDADISMFGTRESFDTTIRQPGAMKITPTYVLNNKTVSIHTDIMPYATLAGVSVHAAVFEETTYNNVGSNGQLQFKHVMMKMIPDVNGEVVTLTADQPVSFDWTANLSGTFIERWGDVKVVVFVQDTSTKVIYQSAYAVPPFIPGTDDRLWMIRVNSFSIAGFHPDSLHYTVIPQGDMGAIPLVVGIPADTAATVVVTQATSFPGTATIDVTAQNQLNHRQYVISLQKANGIVMNDLSRIRIYPNPANDYVMVEGAEDCTISILSPQGRCHLTITPATGNAVDISGLPSGVYIMRITHTGSLSAYRKVVVKNE